VPIKKLDEYGDRDDAAGRHYPPGKDLPGDMK
jgi:hypothetical protein